jgi:hypothetical protein
MWSLSASKAFKKCQRQWYYKNFLANHKAKDPLRRKAYLLSKLQSISAWRGKIVESVIEEAIVPALQKKRSFSLAFAKQKAIDKFDRQLEFARQHRLHQPDFSPTQAGDDFAVFHSMEYGNRICEIEIERARLEIDRALENLISMDEIWSELKQAQRIVTQRSLTFSHTDESVRAVPDLIAFYYNKPPLIIDWKVHTFGVYGASTQLGIYALALDRVNPHKDFPKISQWGVTDFRLWEAQLLTNRVRTYQLDETGIAEVNNFMAASINEIQMIMGDGKKSKSDPSNLLTASSAATCQYCNYQSICWESAL